MPSGSAARVAPDYHVEVDGHYYSVPFGLLRETVDARFTARLCSAQTVTAPLSVSGEGAKDHPGKISTACARRHSLRAEYGTCGRRRRERTWLATRVPLWKTSIVPSVKRASKARN